MQAIISDIIVSQTAQNGNLQVSQNLNNSSSPNVSFADMLASLNQAAEQKPVQDSSKSNETVQPQDTQQSKPVENAKDSDKSEKIKDEQLTKTEQKDSSDAEKTQALTKQTGEKELDKKTPVKNVEKAEPADPKASKAKTQANQNAKEAPKNDALDSKKVLSNEEKQALKEKQNLKLLEEQSVNPDEQEAALSISALAQEGIKNPAAESAVNTQELQQDLTIEDKALEIKADSKSDSDFAAKNPKEKISVVDLRTKQDAAQDSKPVEKTAKNLKVEYNSDNTATVTMELDQQAQIAGENMLSLDNQTAASQGPDFQAMVNNQIQANVPEFVKAGTVLLKDNDKGTINLVLHPDDLGNVKIHLSMDGKTISAHITVNTKEALEVFKDNAQTLREAFAKNGFDTANFDVSYNGNSNGQSGQDFKGLYDGSDFMARNAYDSFLGGGSNDGYIQESWEKLKNSEYLINIVA